MLSGWRRAPKGPRLCGVGHEGSEGLQMKRAPMSSVRGWLSSRFHFPSFGFKSEMVREGNESNRTLAGPTVVRISCLCSPFLAEHFSLSGVSIHRVHTLKTRARLQKLRLPLAATSRPRSWSTRPSSRRLADGWGVSGASWRRFLLARPGQHQIYKVGVRTWSSWCKASIGGQSSLWLFSSQCSRRHHPLHPCHPSFLVL